MLAVYLYEIHINCMYILYIYILHGAGLKFSAAFYIHKTSYIPTLRREGIVFYIHHYITALYKALI